MIVGSAHNPARSDRKRAEPVITGGPSGTGFQSLTADDFLFMRAHQATHRSTTSAANKANR